MRDLIYKIADRSDLNAITEAGEHLFDFPIIKHRALEFFDDPRHHLIVAYFEEKIVGFASGFHYIHPDKNNTLFVNEVAVLDDFQNKRIGRVLVRKLVDYCKGNFSCTEAWVATMETNIAARSAFVAAGGKEAKEKVILIEFN